MSALTLETHLLAYTKLALSRFMGFLPNADQRPNRKDEIVAHICAELLDGKGLRYIWSELSEFERQMLTDALNDPATPGQLDRRAGDWLVVPSAKVNAFRRRVHELGFGVKDG